MQSVTRPRCPSQSVSLLCSQSLLTASTKYSVRHTHWFIHWVLTHRLCVDSPWMPTQCLTQSVRLTKYSVCGQSAWLIYSVSLCVVIHWVNQYSVRLTNLLSHSPHSVSSQSASLTYSVSLYALADCRRASTEYSLSHCVLGHTHCVLTQPHSVSHSLCTQSVTHSAPSHTVIQSKPIYYT